MHDAWPIRPLGDLIELLDFRRRPINSDDRAKRVGNIPYYGANGQQGWIDVPLFDEPLILLAEDGGNFDDFATRPIAYRIYGPSWVNNHAHIVKAATGVNQNFLFWTLVHRDIRRYIAGGTRAKLTQGELRTIEIPSPSLLEQTRIAAILDTLDDTIRQTEHVIAKLQLMKQGLLHDLLTRGIDENGEVRDPERRPELFKDSVLGRIPRGWEVGKLESFGSIRTGNTPSTSVQSHYGGGELFITPGDISESRWTQETAKTLTRTGMQQARPLAPSTVVVTCIGILGRVGQTKSWATTNQQLNSVEPRLGVNPSFLFHAAKLLKPQMERAAGLQVVPIVKKSLFEKLLLPKPPLDEQGRVASIMDTAFERVLNENIELAKLRLLKQGLMDDLLTGKVRVPVEPA